MGLKKQRDQVVHAAKELVSKHCLDTPEAVALASAVAALPGRSHDRQATSTPWAALPVMTSSDERCPIAQVGITWPIGGSHVLSVLDIDKLIGLLEWASTDAPRSAPAGAWYDFGLRITHREDRGIVEITVGSGPGSGTLLYTFGQIGEICDLLRKARVTAQKNLDAAKGGESSGTDLAKLRAIANQVQTLLINLKGEVVVPFGLTGCGVVVECALSKREARQLALKLLQATAE